MLSACCELVMYLCVSCYKLSRGIDLLYCVMCVINDVARLCV